MAKELCSRNITVNAVAPGFIETDMTDKLSEAVKEAGIKQIPLGRFGKPEEVASLVLQGLKVFGPSPMVEITNSPPKFPMGAWDCE